MLHQKLRRFRVGFDDDIGKAHTRATSGSRVSFDAQTINGVLDSVVRDSNI